MLVAVAMTMIAVMKVIKAVLRIWIWIQIRSLCQSIFNTVFKKILFFFNFGCQMFIYLDQVRNGINNFCLKIYWDHLSRNLIQILKNRFLIRKMRQHPKPWIKVMTKDVAAKLLINISQNTRISTKIVSLSAYSGRMYESGTF